LNGADATVEIRGSYKSIVNNLTGSPTVNIGGAWKGSDIADTLVDTAVIGAAGAGLTDLGGMSTGMKSEVESEANDALVALNLDHLMKIAVSDRATMPEVVDDTVLANLMTKTDGDTSDFDPTTDSLEALRDSQAGAIAVAENKMVQDVEVGSATEGRVTIYEADGTTPLLQFDVTSASGTRTRTPV
jgi:hypothetical protein